MYHKSAFKSELHIKLIFLKMQQGKELDISSLHWFLCTRVEQVFAWDFQIPAILAKW